MRDPARIDYMLDRIRRLWVQSPDMRLLQLLICASSIDNGDPNKDLFNFEDRDLAIGINKLLRVMRIESAKPVCSPAENDPDP